MTPCDAIACKLGVMTSGLFQLTSFQPASSANYFAFLTPPSPSPSLFFKEVGFNDVSWHNKEVKTPILQNMADNGVILNQAYSQAACTPWHLGHCRRDVTPNGRGFDTFLGLLNGYNDYYTKKIMVGPAAAGTIYDLFSNYILQSSSDDEYTTDIFTARAQELIRLHTDSPFYITLHYTAPHWPLQVTYFNL
ncbi:hypothetical protein ACOMHN_005083 [Nucella lapillus]